MFRSLPPTLCLTTLLAVLAGCHTSPWSADGGGRSSTAASAANSTNAAAASGTAPAADSSAPGATGSSAKTASTAAATPPSAAGVDRQSLQDVLAEVRKAGALDQASQEQLLQDLQQTDPALWPAIVQQFKAAVAYRQQAEARQMAAQRARRTGSADAALTGLAKDDTPADARPPRTLAMADRRRLASTADEHSDASGGQSAGEVTIMHLGGNDASAEPGSTAAATATASAGKPRASADEPATRASSTCDAKSPPPDNATAAGGSGGGATSQAAAAGKPAGGVVDLATVRADSGGEVKKASYQAAITDEYQDHLAAAIRVTEAALQRDGKTPDAQQRQAQLRLLYLLAGRRDDALRPIPGATPAAQTFLSEEVYGLGLWMDSDRGPDGSRRSAEAKTHLTTALNKLGEACQLTIHNLAFCTKIDSYGCNKLFDKYEFTPGQEVLMYAEVENLTSEATPQGYHTSLQSGYQIFDARNQRVADDQFNTTEEYCRNPRRDYYVDYRFRLPEQMYPGRHTLQLTVRDQKSNKIGQSTIEFTIIKPGKGN